MAQMPGDVLGQQIRDRLAAGVQNFQAQAQAHQARLQAAVGASGQVNGERMHQTVQHAQTALQGLGTSLWHQFQENSTTDAIRSQIDGAVNQARTWGVNYNSTGA